MKNKIKRILPILLSIAILIASVPLSGMISAASAKTITEEFNDLTMWEDIVGNYKQSTAPTLIDPSSIVTLEDGKSVMLPAKAKESRSAYITTVKDEYWPSDRRLESFTTSFLINTSSGNIDNDTAIYIYRPMNAINGVDVTKYWGLAIQMKNNSGKLQWRWEEFKYDSTQSTGCNHKAISQTNSTLDVTKWITATISYDYSAISENQLTITASFTDGTNTSSKSYTHTFVSAPDSYEGLTEADIKALDIYQEGFKVGMSSGMDYKGNRTSVYYFDNFNAQFSSLESDAADDFRTKYAEVLDLDAIETEAQFAKVEEAIAEYSTLSEANQSVLTTEYNKLVALKNGYYALEFKKENAQALALTSISTADEAVAVFTAINNYEALSDEIKEVLTGEYQLLTDLKDSYYITEDNFNSNAFLNEVWESLPENEDIQTNKSITSSTLKSEATVVAESNNSVLLPEYRSASRKRRILTVKPEYLKSGAEIASISTDVRIDVANSFDNNSGIYIYYIDKYNWGRLELQSTSGKEMLRFSYQSGTADDALTQKIVPNNIKLTGMDNGFELGKWMTVKADYTYTDEGMSVTVTVSDTATKTQLYTFTHETTALNSGVRYGYGAGYNTTTNDLVYYDNFKVTYQEAAKPFDEEHKEALALTVDTVTTDDKDIVYAAVNAYNELSEAKQQEFAEEYALLAALKEKIAKLYVASGVFTEDFENGFDFWEVMNNEGEDGGITANPVSDSVNSSEKVLNADGYNAGTTAEALATNATIYKVKDSVLASAQNIVSASGKLYQPLNTYKLALIFEYTDSDNYAGVLIAKGENTDYAFDTAYNLTARVFKYVDGVGTQYAANPIYAINNDTGWWNFSVEYMSDRIRFRVTDENGINNGDGYFDILTTDTFTNTTTKEEDTVFTGNNHCFAFGGHNSNTAQAPYFDDIELVFANSDYAKAADFVNTYSSALVKDVVGLAPADCAEVNAMLTAYNALTDNAKAIVDMADEIAAFDTAISVWEAEDAAAAYTDKYSALINSDITADNANEFEAAWNVINRLDFDDVIALKELRNELVSKLTTYSGTLNLSDKIKVTVIGDSITAGYKCTTNWPALLQTELGDNYDIKNFAISGYNVIGDYDTGVVQWFNEPYNDTRKLFSQQDTDIVIIALGVNDSPDFNSKIQNKEERYEMLVKGYEELIKFYQELPSCSTVIVTGAMWAADGTAEASENYVNKAAKEVCAKTGAVYADLFSYAEGIFSGNEETYLQTDMLHCNDAGQQVVADFFADYFANNVEAKFITENASYFATSGEEIKFIDEDKLLSTELTPDKFQSAIDLRDVIYAGDYTFDITGALAEAKAMADDAVAKFAPTVDGAAIYLGDATSEYYGALAFKISNPDAYTSYVKSFGGLVLPEQAIDGELTLDTESVHKVSSTDTTLDSYFMIVPESLEISGTQMAARAYVVYEYEGNEYIVYSQNAGGDIDESNSKIMVYSRNKTIRLSANKILSDTEYTYDTTDLTAGEDVTSSPANGGNTIESVFAFLEKNFAAYYSNHS